MCVMRRSHSWSAGIWWSRTGNITDIPGMGRPLIVDISVKKLYGYSILPVRVIRLLLSMEMYKTTFHSCGIFPSPKIADAPLGPAVVRERLSKILELAVSEHVCFHNLRHTFATTLLEYGMDVKNALNHYRSQFRGNNAEHLRTHHRRYAGKNGGRL